MQNRPRVLRDPSSTLDPPTGSLRSLMASSPEMVPWTCRRCGKVLFKAYLPPGAEAEGYCRDCKSFSTYHLVPNDRVQLEAFIASLEHHTAVLRTLLLRLPE